MNLYLFAVLIYIVCIAANSESDKKITTPRRDADSWQFTYQASLRSFNHHFCSGAILNKRFILTTANCVFAKSPRSFQAILGAHDFTDYGQRVDIKSIKKHESFDLISMKNDLALLNTIQEIDFSFRIQAIQLRDSYMSDQYWKCTVSGWDQLGNKDELQYQDAIVKKCKSQNTYLHISNGVICAASNSSKKTFNPAKGSLLTDETAHLIGILTKYGNRRTDEPDVYTRISSYLTWIKENSKTETKTNTTLWMVISIVSLAIAGFIVIVGIVVKYVNSQNGRTSTKMPSAAPEAPVLAPTPALELTPTTTVMPTMSVMSYQYPTQVSNLQPVKTGFPQPYVPIALPSAQYPTIPAQIEPPPTYANVYFTKPEFGSPPQNQF